MYHITFQVLGVFAVWLALTLADIWIVAPRWTWYLSAAVAGVAWESAEDLSRWWWGIGVGGAATFLGLLADLVLVATDQAKVAVLRNSRR